VTKTEMICDCCNRSIGASLKLYGFTEYGAGREKMDLCDSCGNSVKETINLLRKCKGLTPPPLPQEINVERGSCICPSYGQDLACPIHGSRQTA
jgi:hypothetical protein